MCLIFCTIYPIVRVSGSLWRVLGVLHQTDVVAASSSVGVVTPRCDAVVDVFSPTHCWAGGPSPADITHPTAGCGRYRWQSSGCGSGRLRVVQVYCHTGCSSSTRYPWRSWWSGRTRRAGETITAISPTEGLPKGAGVGVVVGSSGVNCREGV